MDVKTRAAQIAVERAKNNKYGYTNDYPNNRWWNEPLTDTDCGSFLSWCYHDALKEAGIEIGHLYYEPVGDSEPWDNGFLDYFDKLSYYGNRNAVGDIIFKPSHTIMITGIDPDYITHARNDDDDKQGDWTTGREVVTEKIYSQEWSYIFRLKDKYNRNITPEPTKEEYNLNTLPTLAIGITGYAGLVMTVQCVMRDKLGYDKQKINGIFDEQLDYNIRHLQRENGLYEDGKVGPQTYDFIFKAGYAEP